jgi:predicted dehydrogenase
MTPVGTVVIGCGNIAPFYCNSFPKHPGLKLLGVFDQNGERAAVFAKYYSVRPYRSLAEVLAEKNAELVINLTSPRNHFTVSQACLDAGKNVYSEKPLAMVFSEAQQLVECARQNGLYLASAPSRIFGETAQTMLRALRENAVGKVRAVYAEMDGGLIHNSAYTTWKNELGMPWPYHEEFQTGCTVEHAGYPVSWLAAFFGAVETVTAVAACQVPELKAQAGLETLPPDLTMAVLKFKNGVVARLTSSWLAPHDHSIRIFGDTGILSTPDVWAPKSPVFITRKRRVRIGPKTLALPWKQKQPYAAPPGDSLATRAGKLIFRSPQATVRAMHARLMHLRPRVDFLLGPDELATAFREKRACRLAPEYCLHNTEVVLAIHNALATGTHHRVVTPFAGMEPLPWAAARMARSAA